MKTENEKQHPTGGVATGKIDLVPQMSYPASEDIYSNFEETETDPSDISALKAANDDSEPGKDNEKDFENDMSGDDLDVPGSELDDADEAIGEEDEENNYYSLGGDRHENLDEDHG